MTKKKRVTLIVVLALVLALAASVLWYTRPVTIAQLASLPEQESPYYDVYIRLFHQAGDFFPLKTEERSLSLAQGDPLYEEFQEILSNIRIRRTISGVLEELIDPSITGVPVEDGDTSWIIYINEYSFALQCHVGQFTYRNDSTRNYLDCTVEGGEFVAERMSDFLAEHGTEIETTIVD